MKKEKSCGAIIYKYIDNDIYILLIKHNKGHWSFPKGHIIKGENEKETALREIKEETNLDVLIDEGFRQVSTYSPKENVIKDVVFFLARPINDEIKPQIEEIKEIRWVKYENCKGQITHEKDYNILKKAIQHLKTKNI